MEKDHLNGYASPIIFLTLCFLLLLFSGVFFSGFHFVDDHEIIRIGEDLEQTNFLKTTKEWIERDLTSRFRPLYYIHRIIKVDLFGGNFVLWYLYNFMLVSFSSFFLFKFSRIFKMKKIESFLFIGLALLGPQAAVWWRLGPQEGLGVFLLSLSLFLIQQRLSKKAFIKNKKIADILFVFICFLLSLQKESFLLAVPAIVFLRLFLESSANKNNFWKVVKKRKYIILITGAFLLIELLYIKRYVGLGGYGSAGVYNLPIKKYISSFLMLLRTNYYWFIGLLLLILNLFLVFNKKKTLIQLFKKHLPTILLIIISLAPQILIYSKSGMWERYLLPSSIFLMLATFWSLAIYRRDLGGSKIGHKIFTSVAFIIFLHSLFFTYTKANNFATSGYNNKKLFDFISQEVDSGESILIFKDLSNGCEIASSFYDYVSVQLNRDNIYLYKYFSKNEEKKGGCVKSRYEGRIVGGVEGFDIYSDYNKYDYFIIFPGQINFLDNDLKKFLIENYNNKKIKGRFIIFFNE